MQTRNSVDGMLDQSFSQASALPRNINTVIPGPNGGAWVMAGDVSDPFIFGLMSPMLEQQIFLMGPDGNQVGVPLKFAVPRTLDLVAGPSGSFRLAYGPDQSRWFYWPAPSSASYKIEWYSAYGQLERTMTFVLSLYENFAWAEVADGSLVVTDSRVKSTESPQFLITNSANLRRYQPDGEEDTTFISPGRVGSVKAMPEGKWLIDGVRRLNANGSEDLSWKAPELSRPAIVRMLLALPAGRVLVGGDFATVDGLVKNRLAVFGADGVIDPSFTLDERIAEWESVAVSGKTIYVLTSEPVVYGNGIESNVVKLRSDGTLDETYKPVSATPGELGTIYLAATLVNGRPTIHRLSLTGQLDRAFRGPVFENHRRQSGEYWWKAEETGKAAFDPALATNQNPLYSQSILYHSPTRRLWTGGDFNMVNGQPRDGLARVTTKK